MPAEAAEHEPSPKETASADRVVNAGRFYVLEVDDSAILENAASTAIATRDGDRGGRNNGVLVVPIATTASAVVAISLGLLDLIGLLGRLVPAHRVDIDERSSL